MAIIACVLLLVCRRPRPARDLQETRFDCEPQEGPFAGPSGGRHWPFLGDEEANRRSQSKASYSFPFFSLSMWDFRRKTIDSFIVKYVCFVRTFAVIVYDLLGVSYMCGWIVFISESFNVSDCEEEGAKWPAHYPGFVQQRTLVSMVVNILCG